MHKLENCSITCAELNVVTDMSTRLLDLCRYVGPTKDIRWHQRAKSALISRNRENDEYKRQKDLANNFVAMYASLDIGTSQDLDRLSRAAKSDVTNIPISQLCKSTESGEITVHYLSVPQSLKPWLDKLNELRDCGVFQSLWRQQGEQMKMRIERQPATVNEIIAIVCTPVFSQWQNLSKAVYEGSICLRDVSRIFGKFLHDCEGLEHELQCIHQCHSPSGGNDWIKERSKQMQRYSKFSSEMNAATALQQLCKALDISRTIPEIDSICRQVEQVVFRVDMKRGTRM